MLCTQCLERRLGLTFCKIDFTMQEMEERLESSNS